MNAQQMQALRASDDPAIFELLDVFDAALDWVTDWDDTKPAKGTLEPLLFDTVKSTEP